MNSSLLFPCRAHCEAAVDTDLMLTPFTEQGSLASPGLSLCRDPMSSVVFQGAWTQAGDVQVLESASWRFKLAFRTSPHSIINKFIKVQVATDGTGIFNRCRQTAGYSVRAGELEQGLLG